MGEMADLDLDSMFDPNDDGMVAPRELKTCKYCGKGELVWDKLEDGSWRLFGVFDGEMHSCIEHAWGVGT